MEYEEEDDVSRGRRLTNDQAMELQSALEKDPGNVSHRLRLIGYYCRRDAESVRNRFTHLMWLIEHSPDLRDWQEISLLAVREKYPAELFEPAKRLWLAQVERHCDSAAVLGNAGAFLIEHDYQLGDRLLSQAVALDSSDEYCLRKLVFHRHLVARDSSGEDRLAMASQGLKAAEKLIELDIQLGGPEHSSMREWALAKAVCCAFWATDFGKAEQYANQHLSLIDGWSVQPKSTRSILGLIAVAQGELNTAKAQLLFVNSKAVLDEWDLRLADALIGSGESATVLKYLKKCKRLRFWSGLNLDQWIEELSAGKLVELSVRKKPEPKLRDL